MPGPPPKPTKLHQLRGNPSKHKVSVEPEAPSGRPDPPEHLDDFALLEWHRVCDILAGMTLLSPADVGALELLAVAYSHYRHAQDMIRTDGYETEVGDRGHRQVSVAWSIYQKAWDQYRRMLEQFGLTPAARARMRQDQPAKTPANDAYRRIVLRQPN